MATASAPCLPSSCQGTSLNSAPATAMVPQYPPLNFFYKHLHDSIRAELELLAVLVGGEGRGMNGK